MLPADAATANHAAELQQTAPRRAWPTAPVAAPAATTARLAVVASWTPSPTAYTRAGTASTAPPPPTMPRIRPMSSPKASAPIIEGW